MTRHFVIGTSGHIDHGKSTLVLALTGTDPDRLKEEKERGITIDLGFAHYQESEVVYSFVDVPGHERFVKNMLSGVSGIDAVMLVVAADESVMPQTREHFDICRLLQVKSGVVVLTKRDLVDADTLELVRLEVRDLIAGSFLAAAPIVAVSARTGEGLDELRSALRAVAGQTPARRAAGAVRLPIDRVFSVKGFGTVVTGTLVNGQLEVEQELDALPDGRRVKVRGQQVHGAPAAVALAGQRVAVNLGGVEVADLRRGDTLVSPHVFEPTRRIDAVLELLDSAPPLRHGARVRFHQGTSELMGRVAVARVAGQEGATVPPGGEAHVRIRLEAPAVLRRGDRFVLRAYSPQVTIAGGSVLDPRPPRGATRSAATLTRLSRLDPRERGGFESPSALQTAIEALLVERGTLGLPLDHLVARLGVPPASVRDTASRTAASGEAALAGDVLISRRALAGLTERLLAELAAHHKAQPLADGVPREEAREKVFGQTPLVVFEFLLGQLVQAGRVVARDRLALATHRVAMDSEARQALERIEAVYRDARLQPPDRAALAASVGCSDKVAEQMVQLLLRQKVLVRLDTLLFHRDALEGLKADVRALKGRAPTVDVASFKEKYGISRKFAIPLLEYLDRERVTRRVGDARVIL